MVNFNSYVKLPEGNNSGYNYYEITYNNYQ